MPVSRTQSRSVKQQIADDLRTTIHDGSLTPGARLPTEAEIQDRYDVARNTARDALALLVNEGLIVSRRPHGYFVRDRRRMAYRPQSDLNSHPADAPKDSFLTEQAEAGREPTQTIDVAIVQPPREVTERLGLEPAELAVVRRRIRSLDGEPFLSNDSYFPLSLAQGTEIMSPEDIGRGANRVLAEAGHVQVRAQDEITIRMPTPDEVARLDLAPGTPVAFHIITGFDRNGRALRVVLNVLPGDRHIILFDRPGFPDPEGDNQ